MEKDWLERTELLIGKDDIQALKNKNVLVVGLGGVGSFAAEFIARVGVGKMTIVDGDTVDITNVNRQLPALQTTVNQPKVFLMEDRLSAINPQIQLTCLKEFLMPERMEELVANEKYDFVLDCIDSVTPKLNLIMACLNHEVPIISSMGAGGKLDPAKVKIADISKSHTDPFAHQVRRQMKRRGVKPKGFMVVFSEESNVEDSLRMTDGTNFKKSFYGTISYIPALFGLHMAGYVIRKLIDRV
ncbi:MAG: tRNA threonylcarbamoyladenosine dehydratase [Saprospiraceae bacterium]